MPRRKPSLRESRNRCRAQVQRLLGLKSQAERLRRMSRSKSSWSNPLLIEPLLRQSVRAAGNSVAEADRILDLALKICEFLLADDAVAVGGMPQLFNHLALIHAYRGNVRRLANEFQEASKFFDVAHEWLYGRGTGAPRFALEILSLEASLWTDLFKLDYAAAVLKQASILASEIGDPTQLGRIFLQGGVVRRLMGDLPEAIRQFQQARDLLIQGRNDEWVLVAVHNLADTLCEAGHLRQAMALLRDTGDLYARCGNTTVHLRRTGMEGRIFLGLGEYPTARRYLVSARDGFLRLANAYDALLMSLLLTSVEIQGGTPAAVERRVSEVNALLEHEQLQTTLHQEGRAVLQNFLTAAIRRNATPALLAETLAALRRPARPSKAGR